MCHPLPKPECHTQLYHNLLKEAGSSTDSPNNSLPRQNSKRRHQSSLLASLPLLNSKCNKSDYSLSWMKMSFTRPRLVMRCFCTRSLSSCRVSRRWMLKQNRHYLTLKGHCSTTSRRLLCEVDSNTARDCRNIELRP